MDPAVLLVTIEGDEVIDLSNIVPIGLPKLSIIPDETSNTLLIPAIWFRESQHSYRS